MKNYNRFIPGEEIGVAEPWSFGVVGAIAEKKVSKQEILNAESALLATSVVRQEGYSKGFSEGYRQGHAQAVLDTKKQMSDYIEIEGFEKGRRFEQLMSSTKVQLDLAQKVLSHGVLSLACEIARKILRHELSVKADAVFPVIMHGLTLLVDGGKNVKVRLNPLDYEELKDRVSVEFTEIFLTLVSDSSVACGGCLIESQDTIIDGTIEKRWSRTLGSLGLKSDWAVADE
jgi:flagellar assembly protein FliH